MKVEERVQQAFSRVESKSASEIKATKLVEKWAVQTSLKGCWRRFIIIIAPIQMRDDLVSTGFSEALGSEGESIPRPV